MTQPKEGSAETRLELVRGRIENWRLTREKRTHMPEDLWEETLQLTDQLGFNRVRAALEVNYRSLQKRMAGRDSESERGKASSRGFIELSGTIVSRRPPIMGPILEVANAQGARLTIHLASESNIDLAQLVCAFGREE